MTKRPTNLYHVSRSRGDAMPDTRVQLSQILDSLESGLASIEDRLDRDSAKGSKADETPVNWGRYAASRMSDFGQR